jgi:hypothetical protein
MVRYLLTLVLLGFFAAVLAENVTVTYEDDSPEVTYTGAWETTSEFNELNSGGFHHVSGDKGAMAAFTFTGASLSFNKEMDASC